MIEFNSMINVLSNYLLKFEIKIFVNQHTKYKAIEKLLVRSEIFVLSYLSLFENCRFSEKSNVRDTWF